MELVALKPVAVEARYGALRNKNRALHFGHSTSRSRAALFCLSVSVITPIAPAARIPTHPPIPYDLAERRSRSGINQQKSRILPAPLAAFSAAVEVATNKRDIDNIIGKVEDWREQLRKRVEATGVVFG